MPLRSLCAVAVSLALAAPAALAGAAATWTEVELPRDEWCTPILRDVAFLPRGSGFAVGACGSFRTRDGGASWEADQDLWGGQWFAADFKGNLGVIAGKNWIFQPLVATTVDGGETWTFQAAYVLNNEATLRGVALVAPGLLLAVGHLWTGDGFVVISNTGGASWIPVLQVPQALLDVTFADDGLRGVAVGADGAAFVTTNGGLTWAPAVTGVLRHLWDAHFADATTVVASGSGGTLLRSDDGGLTWRSLPSGVLTDLYAISFDDASTGFAGGAGGVVLGTVDGGATWHPQALPNGAGVQVNALRHEGGAAFAAGNAASVWTTAG